MKKYNAFISYTHKSEMPLALALDAALTKFAKPWNKLRALRIYRDTDSQALTPNLLEAVEQAMAASEYLILLASPSSADSSWVPREIDYWVKSHPLDKLLIVVCEGEVVWDEENGDFDWEKTDCLPETLKGVYDGVPLYLDMRWSKGKEDLDLSDFNFKDAVARLSASLNGKSKEDMLSEEVTQYRRTTRIRNFAITALSVLFVSAAVAATLAVLARNEADRQRTEAIHQRDQALKNLMRIEVQNELTSNRLGHAVQLARTAQEVFDEDPQVRNIAWDVISHPTAVIHEVAGLDYQFARVSPDGNRILMGWENENDSLDVTVQDRFGGNLLTLNSVYGAWFLGDGSELFVLDPSAPMLMVANDENPEDAGPGSICGNEVDFMPAINDGGLAFGLIDIKGVVAAGGVYDLNTQERVQAVDTSWFGEAVHVCGDYLGLFSGSGEFQGWIFSPGVEKAVASTDLQIIAAQIGDQTQIMDGAGRVAATVTGVDPVISPDGSMVATVTYVNDDGLFDYYEYTDADEYPFVDTGSQFERPRGESPDDMVFEMVVFPDDPNNDAGFGYTTVWSAEGKRVATLPGTHPFFAPDGVITIGGLVADGVADRHPRLWSLEAGPDGRHEMRIEMDGLHVVLSPDGQWIASGDDEGFETWIWDSSGRFHAQVEGGLPVFVPGQDVLMTNLHGRLRQWHLPRLRSKSRYIMAGLLGVPPEEVKNHKGLIDQNDCDRNCTPDPVYEVEVTGEVTPMWSITPGTVNGGEEVVSIIRITRGPVGSQSPDVALEPTTIEHRVAGCDPQSERYHGKLLLLACAADSTWRIYDLDVNGGIDDPENHHALMWGKHGPSLSKADFSADGRWVLSMNLEGLLRLWDISSGDGASAPIDLQLGAEVDMYAISADSRLLAAIPVDGPARVWNFEGDLLASLSTRGSDEIFTGLRFFNGSRHLVFAGLDSKFEYFYVPWIVDRDEMFQDFEWLPRTDDAEIERLGLADRQQK